MDASDAGPGDVGAADGGPDADAGPDADSTVGVDVGPSDAGSDAGPIDPCVPPPAATPTDLTIMTRALHATTTDAPWTETMRAAGGVGAYGWTLLSGPPGFMLGADGSATYTPTGAGSYEVEVQVTDDAEGVASATLTLRVRADRLCVWHGATSNAFEDASNWDFCAGRVPGAGDWITIDAWAQRPALLGASTTVRGVGASELEGGTLEVASGVLLTLTDNDRTFQSTVRLAGSPTTCTDCVVSVPGDARVVAGASLVLDNGIEVRVSDHSYLYVGSARPAEAGHFVACGTRGTSGEWPVVSSPPRSDPGHYGIRVSGTAAAPSTVAIDGLKFTNIHHVDAADAYMLDFVEGYRIEKLDHVRMETYYAGDDLGIRVDGCASGEVVDAVWEDLQLELGTDSTTINVNVACEPGVRICIPDATGAGAGPAFEQDPMDVIDWDASCR